MLSRLKCMHDELRAAIAELDAQIALSVPDHAALAHARRGAVRANSCRKTLVDCTIGPALHDVSPEDLERIRELRRTSFEFAVKISQHVAQWGMSAIEANWDGYRRSTGAINQAMLKHIATESAILYPLLESRT